ncbi:Na+/H+ antiporter subunit G [Billgrantia azerbaijanica]|nr:Na+/H+ antiporter subunit G [Halomonas azerbaijanica]
MTFFVIIEGVLAFLLVAGGIFAFNGSLGMLRLEDFYMRLHGPTKGTTLGIGCVLLASMLYFTVTQREFHVQELLITLFLFLTAPVTGHMLAKTGLHMHVRFSPRSRGSLPEFHDEDVGQGRVARPARARHPWRTRKARRSRLRQGETS